MDEIEGPVTAHDMEGVAFELMKRGNFHRADDLACEMFRWYASQSPVVESAILRSRWWLGFMATSGAVRRFSSPDARA